MSASQIPPQEEGEVDCRRCGACCRIDRWNVVVRPEDSTPRHLTRSVRGLIGFASFDADEGLRCMKDRDGICIALRGEIGVSVSCSSYARRPAACREFMPGSPGCLAAKSDIPASVES